MYLKYLWYVLKHKWFVMIECFKVGLVWRGLSHDLSKFHPKEFFAYAKHFYGKNGTKVRDSTGYYKPTDTGDLSFDLAWIHHANHNDHHWQYWAQPDEVGVSVKPMPASCAQEMICDWKGAGRAQGTPDTKLWYSTNKEKMILHPQTRATVEKLLDYEED